MPSLTLALLGSPHVARADGSVVSFRLRKELAVLAYLAIEGPAAQRRDTLLGLLWPDIPEEAARNNLRVVLATLRHTLGAATINANRQTIQLVLDNGALDVVAFQELLALSRAHRHDGNVPCAACAAQLEQAVALYRGDFLDGFTLSDAVAFEEWAVVQREALHQQVLDALTRLAEYDEQVSDYIALCHHARRQLDLEPWHELAQRQLMRGLALAGDRSAALAQYQRCQQVLADELGVEPDVETRALYQQIRSGQLTPSTRTVAAPRHNLPALLTPFIGRDAELVTLAALRDQGDTRLLTVIGIGGMGKTRLALELARASLDIYSDGVFFVELAPLAAASALPTALAQVMSLSIHGGEPAATVLRFLHDKHLLLVLDNFEHVHEGVGLVIAILEAAPRVQILVTSRERLNVRGEQLFVVEGLEYAEGALAPDAAASPATRLFAQSARRTHSGFQIDQQNLPDVLWICQLVQGMPLGLELAAAWVDLLSLREIAGEIARSASFLEASWADAPERQRSMRAVFEWSWRLLNDAERQLFRRLAVFRGPFTRETAESVVGASLRLLASLANKSLLRRTNAGPNQAARYAIHELLRQFADEQLAMLPDERAAMHERHSSFFLTFVVQRETRLARQEPQAAAAEIRAEIDNVRQAWAWAAHERCVENLDRSAGGLWQFIFLTGLASEGQRAFGMACEQIRLFWEQSAGGELESSPIQRLYSKLLALYASALISCSIYDQSAVIAERAVELGQMSEGMEGQAIGLFVWGQALYWKGQRIEARARMEQALQLIAHSQANPPTEAICFVEWHAHVWLRGIFLSLGEYDAARSHGTRALEICQALRSRFGEVHCLCNLADVAREVRDLPVARQSYERALSLIPAVGYRWGEAVVQFELGDVVRLQGDYGLSQDLIERGLAVAREIGNSLEEARAAVYLGRLCTSMGDYGRARAALDHALEVANSLEAPELHVEALLLRSILARQTGDRSGALAYAKETYRLACEFSSRYTQAHALVLLGHAQADAQRSAAPATYEQAIALYEGLSDAVLACEPRAGLAALAFATGNRTYALTQVEAIVQSINAHPRVGLDEPFTIYLICCYVLKDAGDPRWMVLLQTARHLFEQCAATIADPTLQRLFRENVVTNRELLHMA